MNSVSRIMGKVLLALLPGTLLLTLDYAMLWWFNLLIISLASYATVALCGLLRGQNWREQNYLSILVAAWLLALALPPGQPWWLLSLAAIVALGLGREAYGGLGHNPFNPAMLGYAFVLVSFPTELAQWPTASLDLVDAWATLLGSTHDGRTGATWLEHMRHAKILGQSSAQAAQTFTPSGATLWLPLAWLGGGLWLIWQRVINWPIPLAVLIGASAPALLDSLLYDAMGPLQTLSHGGLMLAAFFIATDPVSAPAKMPARILFALMIGLITWAIRRFGAYPDGVAFAVLLMNSAAPALDRIHWRRP